MIIFKSMVNNKNIILSSNVIEDAFILASKNFEYDEIIEKLKSNDERNKAIYILNLKSLNTFDDAILFLSHLIEHNNDIREACAFIIEKFVNDDLNGNSHKFITQNKYAINFIQRAINDINPSICRLIISILNKFDDQYYLQNLIVKNSFEIINNFNASDIKKGYKINKQLFPLYWNLEAISNLKLTYNYNLQKLLSICANMNDFYTIREKVAKILSHNPQFKNAEISKIKNKLKNDDNFYVSRFL